MMARQPNNSGANLGFEADLFKAADKLRGNMEPSDYKHVALGLIFLKHISDSFEARRGALLAEYPAGAEDPDEYSAENVFWVPREARWSHLRASARQPGIGRLVDAAMRAIEQVNRPLQGVLPRDYGRPALNAVMLGELIDLISGIAMNEGQDKARDVLGRVYEYFLGQFAGSEGKRGGEFYTPRSVVRTMVEMLAPHKGRIYDPCCGSGGMFVQSEKFVEAHEGRLGDIAIYGQESNHTTWRLCRMNLAVRGIDADIRWNSEGSSTRTHCPTCAPTTFWPIRRSISRIGAATACARMCAGNSAFRPRAMPTLPGCNTSCITFPPPARRAWCWPMAPCRLPSRAKARSAGR